MSTTMDRMQRTILIVLPLAFVFVIVNFPAGLVLYWVTSNLWTTGQGLITRRLMPRAPVPPPKRSSRTPAKTPATAKAAAPDAKQASAPAPPRKVKRKKKARR
jgi:YidC/Oxa1 family membrane protein insertase